MENKTFATAINCMDGRMQVPVVKWIKSEFPIDFVDMITEPGPNKILAENTDTHMIESIKKRVGISVHKHHSKLIVITGHYDCAGNPVEEEIQKAQILEAIKVMKLWGFEVEIIGLWVDKNWEAHKIN
ncbi:MAG: carbonic anhydrase [bacterium]